MSGLILDGEEIRRLHKAGWSLSLIASRFGISVASVSQSLRSDHKWYKDPALRARWEAKIPAMRDAIRSNISCEKP
jgi:hypothetical protein